MVDEVFTRQIATGVYKYTGRYSEYISCTNDPWAATSTGTASQLHERMIVAAVGLLVPLPTTPHRVSRPHMSIGVNEMPAYPMNIYIEDTDAFAVTYYANYVRFFERAAYDWLGASMCGELLHSRGLLLCIEALDGLKYAEPALLGDECEVRGKFTGRQSCSTRCRSTE